MNSPAVSNMVSTYDGFRGSAALLVKSAGFLYGG
jgi:hypothetical protein